MSIKLLCLFKIKKNCGIIGIIQGQTPFPTNHLNLDHIKIETDENNMPFIFLSHWHLCYLMSLGFPFIGIQGKTLLNAATLVC